ncbi:MAG: N-acetylmuramoyl-L-alanine amidase [Desulfuromonas sp.]|nr:N-acetylmuramoyl-L-alanine amidase [Desulfuromonas sp.]
MRSVWFFVLLSLLCVAEPQAAVELSRQGHSPQLLSEVYHHEGVPYLAIDEVLPALGLSGYWSPIQHRYRIRTPLGKATFFPGGQYLQIGDRFLPLKHRPRFIDGRLRISEDFIVDQLAELVPYPIFYRNLNPEKAVVEGDDGPLDKLFAFLLQKKKGISEPTLRAVAIDPGHGGEETGAIGMGGVKEKTVVLAVAKQLEKQIKMKLGVPIYLSRDDDYYLSFDQHLQSARHDNVDAFLLLHAQASFSPDPHGIHLYVRPGENEFIASASDSEAEKASSMMLALHLSAALRDAGFEVVEVAQAPLMPLVRGNLPTVLIELGYLSNSDDQALLTDAAGQQRLAEALFAGLQAFSADK